MQWLGYVGLTALALCWIPQSVETIRSGRCSVNFLFLILSAVGSSTLAVYAFSINDTVFTLLNTLTTAGAVINIYYKVFPRSPAG